MTIEAVDFIPPSRPIGLPAELSGAGVQAAEAAPGTFAHWFTQQVQRVNGDLATADRQLQALAAGDTQNLHQVMISLEEARLSFQLLMQVRNRVLDAYQDVIRMQV